MSRPLAQLNYEAGELVPRKAIALRAGENRSRKYLELGGMARRAIRWVRLSRLNCRGVNWKKIVASEEINNFFQGLYQLVHPLLVPFVAALSGVRRNTKFRSDGLKLVAATPENGNVGIASLVPRRVMPLNAILRFHVPTDAVQNGGQLCAELTGLVCESPPAGIVKQFRQQHPLKIVTYSSSA
jgi:hypothetical protein